MKEEKENPREIKGMKEEVKKKKSKYDEVESMLNRLSKDIEENFPCPL